LIYEKGSDRESAKTSQLGTSGYVALPNFTRVMKRTVGFSVILGLQTADSKMYNNFSSRLNVETYWEILGYMGR
jgi:hypothetical protein